MSSIYKADGGWRCEARHGAARLSVDTGDHGDEPPAYLLALARTWATQVVGDRDTRADIDALGAAVGVDTKGGKKADALKALRSFDDTVITRSI